MTDTVRRHFLAFIHEKLAARSLGGAVAAVNAVEATTKKKR